MVQRSRHERQGDKLGTQDHKPKARDIPGHDPMRQQKGGLGRGGVDAAELGKGKPIQQRCPRRAKLRRQARRRGCSPGRDPMRGECAIPKIPQRIRIHHWRRGEPGQADRKAKGENPKQHQWAHRQAFQRAKRGKPGGAAKHSKRDVEEYRQRRRGDLISQGRR